MLTYNGNNKIFIGETLTEVVEGGGGGGTTGTSGIFVGYVSNADTSFPTTRLNGSGLENEDYVLVSSNATVPFTIGGITFTTRKDKAIYLKDTNAWYLSPGMIQTTSETPTTTAEESISGNAGNQQAVNIEIANTLKEKLIKNIQQNYLQDTYIINTIATSEDGTEIINTNLDLSNNIERIIDKDNATDTKFATVKAIVDFVKNAEYIIEVETLPDVDILTNVIYKLKIAENDFELYIYNGLEYDKILLDKDIKELVKTGSFTKEADGSIKLILKDVEDNEILNSNIDNVVYTDDIQTITNKSIDADNNTISNIEVDNFKTDVVDTTNLYDVDNTHIATSKLIKEEIDKKQDKLINTDKTIVILDNADNTSNIDLCLSTTDQFITKETDGLKANINLVYDNATGILKLIGKDNLEIATIDLPLSSFLKSSRVEEDPVNPDNPDEILQGTYLILTFTNEDGEDKENYIDLSKLVDIYTSANKAISIEDYEITLNIDNASNLIINDNGLSVADTHIIISKEDKEKYDEYETKKQNKLTADQNITIEERIDETSGELLETIIKSKDFVILVNALPVDNIQENILYLLTIDNSINYYVVTDGVGAWKKVSNGETTKALIEVETLPDIDININSIYKLKLADNKYELYYYNGAEYIKIIQEPELIEELEKKQNKLTASNNITIEEVKDETTGELIETKINSYSILQVEELPVDNIEAKNIYSLPVKDVNDDTVIIGYDLYYYDVVKGWIKLNNASNVDNQTIEIKENNITLKSIIKEVETLPDVEQEQNIIYFNKENNNYYLYGGTYTEEATQEIKVKWLLINNQLDDLYGGTGIKIERKDIEITDETGAIKTVNKLVISSEGGGTSYVYRGFYYDIPSAKHILKDINDKDIVKLAIDSNYYQYSLENTSFIKIEDINIINNLNSQQDKLANIGEKSTINIEVENLKDEGGNDVVDADGNLIKVVNVKVDVEDPIRMIGQFNNTNNIDTSNLLDKDIVYDNSDNLYKQYNKESDIWGNATDSRIIKSFENIQEKIILPTSSSLYYSKELKNSTSTGELETLLFSKALNFRDDYQYITESDLLNNIANEELNEGDLFKLADGSIVKLKLNRQYSTSGVTYNKELIYIIDKRRVEVPLTNIITTYSSSWGLGSTSGISSYIENDKYFINGYLHFNTKPTVNVSGNVSFWNMFCYLNTNNLKSGYNINADKWTTTVSGGVTIRTKRFATTVYISGIGYVSTNVDVKRPIGQNRISCEFFIKGNDATSFNNDNSCGINFTGFEFDLIKE